MRSSTPSIPPSGLPTLRFVNVRMGFGKQVVFDGLNLDVYDGEILTLIGGSGCGKSVLLKMALGLLHWQSGQVLVDGEDISDFDEIKMLPVRRKLGMLFQNAALFDSLSVYENVAYPLRERGAKDEPEIARRVAEVLEMIGLPGVEQKMPAELSGGMRKRVALARAIAIPPKVLMYDEPTTGLDPLNVRRISELILDLNQRIKVTTIVVTHDLQSAYMISDRLAMIAEKRVIAVGATEEFRRSQNETVQQFLNAMAMDTRAA
jgi:phospholipid/cholesterol/gamma-HCH transport system ATP-binding protein